jgi:PRC-barrel domain
MHTTQLPNLLSAGTIIGDPIRNAKGEDLGSIKELMLDMERGRIAYAVLSFGGLLGLGDKLFAVPWQALRLDRDNRQFVLDVDRARLDDAPGFDKQDWPASPDRDFVNRVHQHYGFESYYTI